MNVEQSRFSRRQLTVAASADDGKQLGWLVRQHAGVDDIRQAWITTRMKGLAPQAGFEPATLRLTA
jgi:hypothetical protein